MADCIKRYFVFPALLPRFGEEKQEKKYLFTQSAIQTINTPPCTGGYTLVYVSLHCTGGYILYMWLYTVQVGIHCTFGDTKNVKKCQKSPNLSENV